MFRLLSLPWLLLPFLSTPINAAVDPIVIRGSKFFHKSSGNEFFIKGIAYQPENGPDDPLADTVGCARDIPYLSQLDINLIRVYNVDATSNHSECMSKFSDAGIYVLASLSTSGAQIQSDTSFWTLDLYNSYSAVIDSLAGYDNTFGFFVANAISSNSTYDGVAAVAVKAAVRDMKTYMKSQNYRTMGIGYAADVGSNAGEEKDYYNCGDDSEAIDFLGLNDYSWCGDSTFTSSGYAKLVDSLTNYSIPVFLSEYGCNTVSPRTFSEVSAIYGSSMADVFGGGIAFEYFEGSNNYGLVSPTGSLVSVLPDFTALSTQLGSATPSSISFSAYTPSNTVARSCPATASTWQASPTLPPIPNQDVCDCMRASLSCVASPSISINDITAALSSVCGSDSSSCGGVESNSSTGTYGAYSMCKTTDQLSWALNANYKLNGSKSQSCTLNNLGVIQEPAALNQTCRGLLNQAGTDGTGTITSLPPSSSATSTRANSAATPSASQGNNDSRTGSGNGRGVDRQGLSTGAIVGIVVGIVVLLAILAGLAYWLLKRHQKKVRMSQPPPEGLETGEAPHMYTALRAAEIEGKERQRLLHEAPNGEIARTELNGTDIPRVELSPETAVRREEVPTENHQRLSGGLAPTEPGRRVSTEASWSNQPWYDPATGFGSSKMMESEDAAHLASGPRAGSPDVRQSTASLPSPTRLASAVPLPRSPSPHTPVASEEPRRDGDD